MPREPAQQEPTPPPPDTHDAPTPETEPTPAPTASAPRTEPEATPPPPPPPEPEAPRPSEAGALAGRISGEISAAQGVLLYGPNNILKLGARAPIGTDGSFSFPMPPPGTYRIVVTAGPDAYIFTRPAYRTIVVGPDIKGFDGIDFVVRGKL